MLILNSITVRLGGHLILDNASASLPPKSRVGLVGRNGAGKSTLLKIVAGVGEADDGAVETPRGTRIGYVAQEAPGGAATPFDTVLVADVERAQLLAEADVATAPHRIGEIHERLNLIDAHGAPGRAARILAGLGFDEEAQHRPLDSFSGGWRNHLDVDAREALIQALNEYGGAVVVVSHDRHLLELIADRLVLVADGTATEFVGSLDDYRDRILGRGADYCQYGKPAKRASRKDERRKAAKARERNQALRKAASQAEAEMKRLSDRRDDIDSAMLIAQCQADSPKSSSMIELVKARTVVERKLAVAEDRWLQADKDLEQSEKSNEES